MTIHLPNDLGASLRAEVLSGHYASEDDAVAEIVRAHFRRKQAGTPEAKADGAGLGSIGAMRDAADELDEAMGHAMKLRQQPWRVSPGE